MLKQLYDELRVIQEDEDIQHLGQLKPGDTIKAHDSDVIPMGTKVKIVEIVPKQLSLLKRLYAKARGTAHAVKVKLQNGMYAEWDINQLVHFDKV